LHGNDLTAENTEGTEEENREVNNSDATGFYLTRCQQHFRWFFGNFTAV